MSACDAALNEKEKVTGHFGINGVEEEDQFFATDGTRLRANLVVTGT
jgi:hypothetical protein